MTSKQASVTWKRIPSVTTGGKPYFFRAYREDKWAGSVVWNREVHAYAVDVAGGDRLVAYVSTVREGKALVEKKVRR